MGSLSDVQQQVVLGCILGDGYMRKKTHAHLQITHSFEQREYVDWKYKILENLVNSKPSTYKGNSSRVGYRFFTKSLPELTGYYNQFYPRDRKLISEEVDLSPLSLAVWYMDDGSKSYKTCYFNTQSFDLTSQQNLINSLKKVDIKSTLNKDKKYYRIRIATESAGKLFKSINPFVIESMHYKLPM